MKKLRNAAIVIVLCIIGYSSMKKKPALVLNLPAGEEMKDALAGNPASKPGRRAPLNFRLGGDDNLRDSLAASPAMGPAASGPPAFNPAGVGSVVVLGNGSGGGTPPPRGNGKGFQPAGATPPTLSQSAPPEEDPPCLTLSTSEDAGCGWTQIDPPSFDY